MTVLGIDPGTASCGFGVVIEKGGRLRAVDFGCWKTTASQRPEERLLKIHDGVVDLIDRYEPRAIAIEESFVGADARTALSVGQARGAAVVAAALAGVACAEYSPSHVKLAVTGYGRAEKAQVQRMARDYRDDNYSTPIKPVRGRSPDTILVEAKANGQMLIHDLARAGIIATKFNPDKFGDKIARVRLVTDIIENGRVWLPAMGPSYDTLRPWAADFLEQCVQFPAADSRDWVDTMTMAFLRIKQSGWVANTEDPMEETYDTPRERVAFY